MNEDFERSAHLCKNTVLLPILVPMLLEAVSNRFSVKKVFLDISHNLLENTCARVSPF